jgi:hypothetical protein
MVFRARKYWLSSLLVLVLSIFSIWSLFGIRDFNKAISVLRTPVVLIVPTQALPTQQSSLPDVPVGPLELTFNPADQILYSTSGEPIFRLTENKDWVPIPPSEVRTGLSADIEVSLSPDGFWVLQDQYDRVLFRWDKNTWSWSEVPLSTLEVEVVDPKDSHYQVVLPNVNADELTGKTDIELLNLAPKLEPGVFGLNDAQSLVPSEVLRTGTSANTPYLLYFDQNDRVRLGWNVMIGQIEHVGESKYLDEVTGMQVRALVITDSSVLDEGKRWYTLKEINEISLAKAFMDYTFPLNYMFTNYRPEFRNMMGMQSDNDLSRVLAASTQSQVSGLISRARNLLITDYAGLSESEKLDISIDRVNFQVGDGDIVVLLRLSLVSSSRFNRVGSISTNTENILEININLGNEEYIHSSPIVGGFLVEAIRIITVGGDNGTHILQTSNLISRSTIEEMTIELCGEEAINKYLSLLNGEIRNRRIVPVFDQLNEDLPVCVLEEIQQ